MLAKKKDILPHGFAKRARDMEDKDTLDLRQQVVESTKLLLKAVDSKSKGEGRSSSSALAVPSICLRRRLALALRLLPKPKVPQSWR